MATTRGVIYVNALSEDRVLRYIGINVARLSPTNACFRRIRPILHAFRRFFIDGNPSYQCQERMAGAITFNGITQAIYARDDVSRVDFFPIPARSTRVKRLTTLNVQVTANARTINQVKNHSITRGDVLPVVGAFFRRAVFDFSVDTLMAVNFRARRNIRQVFSRDPIVEDHVNPYRAREIVNVLECNDAFFVVCVLTRLMRELRAAMFTKAVGRARCELCLRVLSELRFDVGVAKGDDHFILVITINRRWAVEISVAFVPIANANIVMEQVVGVVVTVSEDSEQYSRYATWNVVVLITCASAIVRLVCGARLLTRFRGVLRGFILTIRARVMAQVIERVQATSGAFLARVSWQGNVDKDYTSADSARHVTLHYNVVFRRDVCPVHVVRVTVNVMGELMLTPVMDQGSTVRDLLVRGNRVLFYVRRVDLADCVLCSVVDVRAGLHFAFTPLLNDGGRCAVDANQAMSDHADHVFRCVCAFGVNEVRDEGVAARAVGRVGEDAVSRNAGAASARFRIDAQLAKDQDGACAQYLSLRDLRKVNYVRLNCFIALRLGDNAHRRFLLLSAVTRCGRFVRRFHILLRRRVSSKEDACLSFL